MGNNMGNNEEIEHNENKFSELEIIHALSDLRNISYEMKFFLESQKLIDVDGRRIKLSYTGEQILTSVKNSARNIMNGSIEKSDITLETQIEKLDFFPGNHKKNNSIILELKQYYNVFTLGDLMKNNLIGFSVFKSEETKLAFAKFLGELKKMGFIRN